MRIEPLFTTNKYKQFFNLVKKHLINDGTYYRRVFGCFDEEVKGILDKIDEQYNSLEDKEWKDFLLIASAKVDYTIPYKILTFEPNLPDNVLIDALDTNPDNSAFINALITPKSKTFLDYCLNNRYFMTSLQIHYGSLKSLRNSRTFSTKPVFHSDNINYMVKKLIENPKLQQEYLCDELFQFFDDEKLVELWLQNIDNFKPSFVESINTAILNNENLSDSVKNNFYPNVDFIFENICAPTPELAHYIYELLSNTIDDNSHLGRHDYKTDNLLDDVISRWLNYKCMPETLQKDYLMRKVAEFNNSIDLGTSNVQNILLHTPFPDVLELADKLPHKFKTDVYHNPNISQKEVKKFYNSVTKSINKQLKNSASDITLNDSLMVGLITIPERYAPTVEQAITIFKLDDTNMVSTFQDKILMQENVSEELIKSISKHSDETPNLSAKNVYDTSILTNGLSAKIRLKMMEAGYTHEDYKAIDFTLRRFSALGNNSTCYDETVYRNINKCADEIKNGNDELELLDKTHILSEILKVNIDDMDKLISLINDLLDEIKDPEYELKIRAFMNSFVIAQKHKELNSVFDVNKNTLQHLKELNMKILSDIINVPCRYPTDIYTQIDKTFEKFVVTEKEINKRIDKLLNEKLQSTITINNVR